jgi:GT2 family glycosyltransferase
MDQPFVYIVILNWNGWKDTVECLESVFKQSYSEYFVFVLDNDSADQSFDKITDWLSGKSDYQIDAIPELKHLSNPEKNKPLPFIKCKNIEDLNHSDICSGGLALVNTGGNLGFAGGNNVALRWITENNNEHSYVWLLNNDTVIENDCLSEMLTHLQLKEKTARYTCGSLVKFYQQPGIIQALGGAKFNRYTAIGSQTLGRFLTDQDSIDHTHYQNEMEYITGCSWLLPVDYLTEIGLMEDQYFLYYEEIDWVIRGEKKYKLTYAPKSIVYHKEGASIGSKTINRAPSLLSEFYMGRNKLLFMRKHYPHRVLIAYAVVFLQAINRIRQREFKNARILFKVLLGKANFK